MESHNSYSSTTKNVLRFLKWRPCVLGTVIGCVCTSILGLSIGLVVHPYHLSKGFKRLRQAMFTTLYVVALCYSFQCVQSAATTCDKHCEYDYSVRRNTLFEKERELAGYQQSYDNDEQIVYGYLEYLKWKEFNRTRHDFPSARPLKYHINDVKATQIYKLLKKFPKGGNLHLHHNHVVSKERMLDLIENSTLYENLYVKRDPPGQYAIDFFINPPDGWVKVKGNPSITKSMIADHATLLGVMDDNALNRPTDSELRWKEITPLFDIIGSHVINNANFCRIHMHALLESATEENVQYLETKSSAYNKLYILDTNNSYALENGKHYIDNYLGELELQYVSDVLNSFKKNNPNFIGYKRVVNGYRGASKRTVAENVANALKLYEKYPDLVSGFDLVAEEDLGYSLLFFLEDLASTNTTPPYFFHTGETNWPDDLMTSLHEDDPVPTMDNLYESILLGAKRVGHGIGYIKHPLLMEILKSNKIAIEVNPVSNKLLGYVADQRHHPAITYLRYGIPIILGADDPGTFGYNEFTYDWYEAFMSWGLTLADMRHLAENSLKYSSMSSSEKNLAVSKWTKAYNKFIADTKLLACSETFTNVNAVLHSIFPREASAEGGTKIQVFGRNFHIAICKQIICKFGQRTTNGVFKYGHLITCVSPNVPLLSADINLKFSISLDGGTTYLQETFDFTYFSNHTIKVPEIPVGK